MSLREVVIAEVNKLSGGAITAEIAESLRERVLDACQLNGIGDPLSADAEIRGTGDAWYFEVVSHFVRHNWLLPATVLLHELWDRYAELQRTEKKRVYRALISQLLTEVTYAAGQLGEALRWALLTQADDLLGEHGQQGGYGRHWLYGVFGLSKAERNHIESTAKGCLTEAKKSGWGEPAGYAEEVIRRAIQSETGRAVLQRRALTDEFHLTPPYLRALLDRLETATTSQEKGERLEDVAFYLFSLLGGCFPRRNLLDVAGVSEYDLVVNNLAAATTLAGSSFGRDFLVESKNWAKAVGVQEIGYFLLRIGLTHCNFGVVLASKGITEGKEGEEFATALIRRAYQEHGTACIVIDIKDLERLAAGGVSTVTGLMVDRLYEFRFGKPKAH